MSFFSARKISICGISAAVPTAVEKTQDFIGAFGEKTTHKFANYLGVDTIHKTYEGQTASDLGFAAAQNLIHSIDVPRDDIGLLIYVTLSPDYRRPPTSCVLQYRLGLSEECACLDVGHGCAGFVYGHQTMVSLMATMDSKYGLMILGETNSKLVSPYDKSSMLFGDAGGAVLYKKGTEEESHSMLKTNGGGYRDIIIPGGGFRDRFPDRERYLCEDGIRRSKEELHMNGLNVYNYSTSEVPNAIIDYLHYVGRDISWYDRVFFHQANKSILDSLRTDLGISDEKAPDCLKAYGNTSSASIPLAICDYYSTHSAKHERILACGYGVGLSLGVTSFEIDLSHVLPVISTDITFDDGINNG